MQRGNIESILAHPFPDTIPWWIQQYFLLHVTTSVNSQRIQKRDLNLFCEFMQMRVLSTGRRFWTPDLSADFLQSLRTVENVSIYGPFSDRTVDRVIAHLKKFSKWIHKLLPLPLGDPMAGIDRLGIGRELKVHGALTDTDRKKILSTSDELVRIAEGMRQRRKGYRPYRNRAIIYTLIETGMPRTAITELDLKNLNFQKKSVSVYQRGNLHTYQISDVALRAIKQYMQGKRPLDAARWKECPALFLTAETVRLGNGRLTPVMVNAIWNKVCKIAGVKGKTPHSARHAMGKYIMQKTGSAAAVQHQLGHRSVLYAAQYSSATTSEIKKVINER